MGWSPRWWRASTTAVLVATMGSWWPAGPAHGQVVRAPGPFGGPTSGAFGGTPTVVGPGPGGPGSIDPTHLRPGLGDVRGAPTPHPTGTSSTAADPRGSSGSAQRATHAARRRVARAIEAIGMQNREDAAIVRKLLRVAP